jgi:hypothetical protein
MRPPTPNPTMVAQRAPPPDRAAAAAAAPAAVAEPVAASGSTTDPAASARYDLPFASPRARLLGEFTPPNKARRFRFGRWPCRACAAETTARSLPALLSIEIEISRLGILSGLSGRPNRQPDLPYRGAIAACLRMAVS